MGTEIEDLTPVNPELKPGQDTVYRVHKLAYHITNFLYVALMAMFQILKHDKDAVIIVDGKERCQPKGNIVLMADGSWKDISEIQIGDTVISPQEDGTTIFSKVVRTSQYENCQIYSITELYKQHTELYSCSGQHNIPIWKVVDKHRIKGDRDKRTSGHWDLQYLPAEFYSKLPIHTKMNRTTMLSNARGIFGRCAIDAKPTGFATVYGIELDSPSQLYITNNYAVTHNSGKSVLAQQIAYFLDATFTIDRICFTPQEFVDAIRTTPKGGAIILDEALTTLFSRQAMTRNNVDMVKTIAEVGQKNLVLLVVLPTFFDLDKYISIWRAIGLFHVVERGGNRGYYDFYGEKELLALYASGKAFYNYGMVRARWHGQFQNIYTVEESEYRQKKSDSLMNSMNKSKTANNPKREAVMKLHNDGLSEKKIAEKLTEAGIKISKSWVHQIIAGE